MRTKYIIGMVNTDEFYDGTNTGFESIGNHHFSQLDEAYIMDDEPEAIRMLESMTEVYGYLEIKKIYITE